MTQLESLLFKYDFPKRETRNALVFDNIEQIIGFQLPEDYKFYLMNFIGHECFIGPEYVKLWDFDSLLENNIGYGTIGDQTNVLAIGGNGAGECIAIDHLDENNDRIVLSPFIGFDRENYISIGSSFTDMLVRLDNGKEWFNAD